VSYLVSLGKRVFVDLEHFFDGFKFDEEYSLECCRAAVDAGNSWEIAPLQRHEAHLCEQRLMIPQKEQQYGAGDS
ncbi:unnamed protein product, partial [marine sediment metagenome]